MRTVRIYCEDIHASQRLQETLRQSPDEQQSRLAELTRKVTLLRVNEQNLVRKYQAMVDSEAFYRRVPSYATCTYAVLELHYIS